jgi:hypothetical protein
MTDCSGTCVDLTVDPNHCGACTTVCPATQPMCDASACTSGPCDGICATATTIAGGSGKNNIGTTAQCYQVVLDPPTTPTKLGGGNCGNFSGGRTFKVNGTDLSTTCAAGGNWPSVPATKGGGYCIAIGAGNESYAWFGTWW